MLVTYGSQLVAAADKVKDKIGDKSSSGNQDPNRNKYEIDLNVKPNATNRKLQNIVKDIYKGQGPRGQIGNGTTMDAIRNEILTGKPTKGIFHSIKGGQYINALKDVLSQNLSELDRAIAEALLKDLQNALAGK